MPSLPAALERLRPANRFDSVEGAIYDFGVEHESLGRLFGWLMWGADARQMYTSMQAIAAVPAGGTILDIPCGGGVAFRALQPEQKVRYVAADLSQAMLERARSVARGKGLSQVELVRSSVESLPLDDAGVDLVLCYNGLHCFPDPAKGLAEMARCLKPGGRLVGTTVLRGEGRRYDALIEAFQRLGTFGPGNTRRQLKQRAAAAELRDVKIKLSGSLALIEARK